MTAAKQWQGFYSLADVSRIAAIPLRTLQEWRQRGIVAPSVDVLEEGVVVAEGYSYADLTVIRLLRALREDEIDFRSAGLALRHLYERFGPPSSGWADSSVYFVGKLIFAERPEEWVTEATQLGQGTMPDLFGELFPELRALETGGDILVPRQFRAFVEIHPQVMGGEPVIKGTRVPTRLIATIRQRGRSLRDISRLYSMIPRKLLAQAIEYEAFLDNPTGA